MQQVSGLWYKFETLLEAVTAGLLNNTRSPGFALRKNICQDSQEDDACVQLKATLCKGVACFTVSFAVSREHQQDMKCNCRSIRGQLITWLLCMQCGLKSSQT